MVEVVGQNISIRESIVIVVGTAVGETMEKAVGEVMGHSVGEVMGQVV